MSKTGTLVRAFSLPDPLQLEMSTSAEPTFALPRDTIAPQPAPSKRRRPARGERMAVYLPPELAEELRVRCARERRSMSDAVSEAVGLWAQRPTGT